MGVGVGEGGRQGTVRRSVWLKCRASAYKDERVGARRQRVFNASQQPLGLSPKAGLKQGYGIIRLGLSELKWNNNGR